MMRRAASELLLGARLSATGGADSRLRAGLTALGVSLGVALLLFAASVPNMVSAHERRLQARVAQLQVGSARSARLLTYPLDTTYHGTAISIIGLEQTRPDPPLPPGLSRIPAPGQIYVSPALRALLRSPAGVELGRRLHARIAGTIADTGLGGPAELLAYRGATGLARRGGSAVSRFGGTADGSASRPVVTLLVILMVAALLMPVGVFVATASRFGSEQRNERLAALRLLGLDRTGTARVAAGEALIGALAGVVVGVVGFLAILRPLVPHTDIANISAFMQDVRPSPALAALALGLVPVSAVGFTLLAMRQVAIEPLGVSRHGRPPRRRLGWRLAAPGLGFLLLIGLFGSSSRLNSTGGEVEAAAGIILVLLGVCALLPWLVEAAVLRAGAGEARGTVSWLLAVRRLRLDHGTSGRVVGAIGLAVAGAIALQMVFTGAERSRPAAASARAPSPLQVSNLSTAASDPAGSVARRLRSIRGVHGAVAAAMVHPGAPISVASCDLLVRLVRTSSCGPQSAYLIDSYSGLKAGGRIPGARRDLRVPAAARRVSMTATGSREGAYMGLGALLLAPGAATRLGLHPHLVSAVVWAGSASGTGDRVRDAVARIDPLAQVNDVDGGSLGNSTLDKLRRVLTAGAVAVLLVIGASLLVSLAEQLRERRRVLAVMSAFGTRASTLACSVLWQAALPVLLGLALAIALGDALGAALMRILGIPVSFDWGAAALLAGAGLGVVLAVTALTLPILHRQTRPEALRAE